MTREEIAAWKAQQQKRPLAERLSEIPGHQAEAKPTQAEVSYEDSKKLRHGE